MQPTTSSLSPSHQIQPLSPTPSPQPTPISIPEPNHFPSTGLPIDLILNTAYTQNIISEDGRIIDSSYDINDSLHSQISAAGTKLAQNLKKNPNKISPYRAKHLPPIKTGLYDLIKRFKTTLNEPSNPEIIGSAVPYFLGEEFFVHYLTTRLGFTDEQAKKSLQPLIHLLNNPPNDIDCRIILSTPNHPALASAGACKDFFTRVVGNLPDNLTPNKRHQSEPKIPLEQIKSRYFEKLAFVPEKGKTFGIARMGEFIEGIPLEMIIVGSLKRSYITLHKSPRLVLHPPINKATQTPAIELMFHDSKRKDDNRILPETALFQQTAMVLDAPDLEGVDWRGFISVIIEMTKGYRTLSDTLLAQLWLTFSEEAKPFLEKIQWGVDNHLPRIELYDESLNPLPIDPLHYHRLLAYYLTILFYLVDSHPECTDEIEHITTKIIESGAECEDKTHAILAIFLKFIAFPDLDIHTKLAWFRIALWLKMDHEIAPCSLSTNHGQLCHRWVDPETLSVVWLPISINSAVQTLRSPHLTIELFDLIAQVVNSGKTLRHPELYQLAHFEPHIHSSLTKKLSDHLRAQHDNPQAMDLALQIDLARMHAISETTLPTGWIQSLPHFLTRYPDKYPLFKHSFPFLPELEQITSLTDFACSLIGGSNPELAPHGLRLFEKLQPNERVLVIDWAFAKKVGHYELMIDLINRFTPAESDSYTSQLQSFIFQLTGDLLNLSKVATSRSLEPSDLPWILFSLLVSRGSTQVKLISTQNGLIRIGLHINKSNHELSFRQENLVAEALSRFEAESDKTLYIALFESIVATINSEAKVSPSEPEREAIRRVAQPLFDEPVDSQQFLIGYKLKTYLLLTTAKPIPIAIEILRKYPAIHSKTHPHAQPFARVIFIANDLGSQKLDSLIKQPNEISMISWVIALILHGKKECQEQGKALFQQLSRTEQALVWEEISPILLKSKPGLILSVLTLVEAIDITPKSQQQFFIDWFRQTLHSKNTQAKKEAQAKELKGHLQSFFSDPKEVQELKRANTAIAWLGTALKIVENSLREKPPATIYDDPGYVHLQQTKRLVASQQYKELYDHLLAFEPHHNGSLQCYRDLLIPIVDQFPLTRKELFQLLLKYKINHLSTWVKLFPFELKGSNTSLFRDPEFLALLTTHFNDSTHYGANFWKGQTDQEWGSGAGTLFWTKFIMLAQENNLPINPDHMITIILNSFPQVLSLLKTPGQVPSDIDVELLAIIFIQSRTKAVDLVTEGRCAHLNLDKVKNMSVEDVIRNLPKIILCMVYIVVKDNTAHEKQDLLEIFSALKGTENCEKRNQIALILLRALLSSLGSINIMDVLNILVTLRTTQHQNVLFDIVRCANHTSLNASVTPFCEILVQQLLPETPRKFTHGSIENPRALAYGRIDLCYHFIEEPPENNTFKKLFEDAIPGSTWIAFLRSYLTLLESSVAEQSKDITAVKRSDKYYELLTFFISEVVNRYKDKISPEQLIRFFSDFYSHPIISNRKSMLCRSLFNPKYLDPTHPLPFSTDNPTEYDRIILIINHQLNLSTAVLEPRMAYFYDTFCSVVRLNTTKPQPSTNATQLSQSFDSFFDHLNTGFPSVKATEILVEILKIRCPGLVAIKNSLKNYLLITLMGKNPGQTILSHCSKSQEEFDNTINILSELISQYLNPKNALTTDAVFGWAAKIIRDLIDKPLTNKSVLQILRKFMLPMQAYEEMFNSGARIIEFATADHLHLHPRMIRSGLSPFVLELIATYDFQSDDIKRFTWYLFKRYLSLFEQVDRNLSEGHVYSLLHFASVIIQARKSPYYNRAFAEPKYSFNRFADQIVNSLIDNYQQYESTYNPALITTMDSSDSYLTLVTSILFGFAISIDPITPNDSPDEQTRKHNLYETTIADYLHKLSRKLLGMRDNNRITELLGLIQYNVSEIGKPYGFNPQSFDSVISTIQKQLANRPKPNVKKIIIGPTGRKKK